MSSVSPLPVSPVSNDQSSDIELKPPYVPPEPRTVFLGGIFTLMVLAACSAASGIIIPIVLAFMFKMVLSPIMRFFARIHVPRILGAILIIGTILGGVGALGTALSTPALEWAQDLPQEFPKLKERLHDLRNPMAPLQRVLSDAQDLASTTPAADNTVIVKEEAFSDRIISQSQHAVAGLLEMVVVLFFLLVSGDTFLRRLVEILPRFTDKKQAINISNQMESDISAYLLTITCMNAAVGIATAILMSFCNIGDPVLWGLTAFVLNFIPIAGPIVGIGLFSLVGLMSESTLGLGLLPAILYLSVHVVESQFVTPMLLARHFTLNPVLVILGLIFFYWLWGIPGAILSTPILAVIKVICDNVVSMKPLGHFIEG